MKYKIYFETDKDTRTSRSYNFSNDTKAIDFAKQYNLMNVHIKIVNITRSIKEFEGFTFDNHDIVTSKILYDTTNEKRKNATIPHDLKANITTIIPLLENFVKGVGKRLVNKNLKI